jgi:hypothetical protein
MFHKKLNGHTEKLNTKIYWYDYIEKKVSSWRINVVTEVILKLYDVCFMKNI